jgi:hypothetical protein
MAGEAQLRANGVEVMEDDDDPLADLLASAATLTDRVEIQELPTHMLTTNDILHDLEAQF